MPEKSTKNMQLLTSKLLEEVRNYGIPEASMRQYETACRSIVNFAKTNGTSLYSPGLIDDFRKHLDGRIESGEICHGYRRFQNRVVRMLSSLAETGSVDFSKKKSENIKYPVPDEISAMVEDIMDGYPISEKTRSDLRAPIRHNHYDSNHFYDYGFPKTVSINKHMKNRIRRQG